MYADSGLPLYVNMEDVEIQRDHMLKTRKRKALLEGFIEQLEDLGPSECTYSRRRIRFSILKIERVSGDLYRNGHYKSAALEAYIRVIHQVKVVSGINEDGDSLMNKAFAADKQTPVVQFNGLTTESERDEQRGLLFLFKGIVGIRNSKAHDNRLFDDPKRAHEYLALSSSADATP